MGEVESEQAGGSRVGEVPGRAGDLRASWKSADHSFLRVGGAGRGPWGQKPGWPVSRVRGLFSECFQWGLLGSFFIYYT